MLDKLDVTYQSAFTASEKPSPPAAYTSSLAAPLKKMLHAFIGSQKPSTPSPVARADYVSPYKEKYWAMMTKNIRQQMKGMKEAHILEAINKLRNENPEYHDSIIDNLVNQYDEYSQSSKEYVSEGLKGL